MEDEDTSISLSGGDVRAWIEQETVHIKAVERNGDPVELSETEVRKLADALQRFYAKIT